MTQKLFLRPNWPAPKNIKSLVTLRKGSTLHENLNDFNMSLKINNNLCRVMKNHLTLNETANLPTKPMWLNQTHSDIIISSTDYTEKISGDACFTNKINKVCAILTADCLPILICNKKGDFVSAIHAGWRGLGKKIISKTLNKTQESSENLIVWLGPAIGPNYFEVGNDVKSTFIKINEKYESAFNLTKKNTWMCDIYTIARIELEQHNITNVYGGEYCTYSNSDMFYSYRREGKLAGRMASLIWISD
ncbi:peptidoglycan editing factor PgeF [Gammaproteobacteria bacterium]|nr:peptidoglycan editing factor PgeF [Gammaproteobacteria bacterium]